MRLGGSGLSGERLPFLSTGIFQPYPQLVTSDHDVIGIGTVWDLTDGV